LVPDNMILFHREGNVEGGEGLTVSK
jgi:hypothetical protein